jgi:AraC family transcriptional regulator
MKVEVVHLNKGARIDLDPSLSSQLASHNGFVILACSPGTAIVMRQGLVGVWCPVDGQTLVSAKDSGVLILRRGLIYVTDSQRHQDITIPSDSSSIGVVASQSSWSELAACWGSVAGHDPVLFPSLHPLNHAACSRFIRFVRETIRNPEESREPERLWLLASTIRELQREFDSLVARCPGHSIAKRTAVFLRLQRARNHIAVCANNDRGVENLALVANYSVWRFIKIFHLVFGETPYSYISRTRIEHAKKLLIGSDLGIGDIAFATGFESRSSFTRAIKNHLGSSASEFRHASRANNG